MTRSSRTFLRGTGFALLALFLATLTWGLPAVYAHRYDKGPTTSTSTAPGGATAKPSTPQGAPPLRPAAEHPKPSAQQNATYIEQTQTKAQNPGVAVVGRDGYVFFGDAYLANFAMAMGRRYYTPDEVARTDATIAAEKAWLASRKIAMEFVVSPANWAVYPDKLPAWADGQRLPTIVDQLLAYDPTSILDLRADLTAARAQHDVYSKKNSHWTFYGGFVGWASIAKQLQARHPGIGALHVPTLSSVTTTDEQNEFTALTGDPGPNDWTVPHFSGGLTGYDVTTLDGKRTTQGPGAYLDITQSPLTTTSASAGNTHRALILADSTVTSISPYLATAFGSTMIVRHSIDKPENAPSIPALVESYKPDVVLSITTERNLDEPIHDLDMWQAALDYDKGAVASTATWTPSGPASAITVAGPRDLASAMTVTLPATLTQRSALRIRVDSTKAATLELRGTTKNGPVIVPVRIAPGPTTTFATLPAGLTGQTLTIVRTAGDAAVIPTEISSRALP